MKFLVFAFVLWCSITNGKDVHDKLDRFVITCHTTDFTCFKRQYKALRNNALLGNEKLAIRQYEPYVFKYGNSGTCIKMSGLEESELIGISINSDAKEVVLTLELPVRIQQVDSSNLTCLQPDNDFEDSEIHTGTMKSATGNATLQVLYPYELRKKKGQIYLMMDQEDVDILLDIQDPDDINLATDKALDLTAPQWAYDLVQHIDAAQYFALPYTGNIRGLFAKVPLERLIMLYPEEEYTDLKFSFEEDYLSDFNFDLKNYVK